MARLQAPARRGSLVARAAAFLSLLAVAACGGILGTHFDDVYPEPADGGADNGGRGDASSACGADDADFYARADAAPGAGHCVFTTITEAVAAARRSHAPTRSVHVANGNYSAASGEAFPIDLRGGISLEGEGPSTVLDGVGHVDIYSDKSSIAVARATILVGDEKIASRVSGVRMTSGMVTKADAGVVGIYCNRGNAVAGRAQPPPNLTIERVQIGIQYSIGIAISNRLAPVQSGCNARIVSSAIEGISWQQLVFDGIAVNGCSSLTDRTYVAAEIGGDDPALANRFFENGVHNVAIGGCVAAIDIVNNTFTTGASGIWIDWGGDDSPSWVSIRRNTFQALANGAVDLIWGAHVDELRDNTFIGNDLAAILLWDHDTTAWPKILRARGNSFVGNHVAICIDGSSPFNGMLDFGKPDDPGGNSFSCNSYAGYRIPCHGQVVGGDVLQFVPLAANTTATFVGNTWDHAPPTVSPTLSAQVDGIDYYAVDGKGATFGDSTVATAKCQGTFTPGP